MCSWCYAFSQSWAALQQALPRDMEIIYLVGGLAPDTTEPMPLATQKMVQQAWQRIEPGNASSLATHRANRSRRSFQLGLLVTQHADPLNVSGLPGRFGG